MSDNTCDLERCRDIPACRYARGCVEMAFELARLKEEGRKDYEGMREFQSKFIAASQEFARLREEQELLVGQLAGCGVAALQDTEEFRKQRINRDSPYWTASYGDVCRRVDECISLRAELARLRALCGEAADRLEDMDTAWTIAWYNMTNEQKRRTLRQCDTVGLPNGFVLMAIFAGNKSKDAAARGAEVGECPPVFGAPKHRDVEFGAEEKE